MYRIIPFENEYRDDTIYCFLLAKGSLGKVPRLNDDMLDIPKSYFDKGDMFWIAINDDDRVIGMIGTNTISESEIWLKRLFIMPEMRRNGLGSALLYVLEKYAKSKGVSTLHTRFPDDFIEAGKFYPAKGFIDAEMLDECRHIIKTL